MPVGTGASLPYRCDPYSGCASWGVYYRAAEASLHWCAGSLQHVDGDRAHRVVLIKGDAWGDRRGCCALSFHAQRRNVSLSYHIVIPLSHHV